MALVTSGTRDGLSGVRVNVFPGGFNWGVYIGIDKGFFARHGLAVTVEETPNSVAQMTGLSQGSFEIAMTAVDNIVAYVEGQGEAPIGAQPDFSAFMGSDSGFLSLVTVPEVEYVRDLAGKTLSVDALTTGYAFVLYEILRRNGLDRGDYQVRRVGGMVQRWNSLLERNEHGTLLSAPYNLLARRQGFVDLVKPTAVLGSYQGNVAAARRSWASAHASQVIAYIRGYRDAIAWLYQPANRTEAIAILRRNLPQMPQDVAEASHAELLDPGDGFFRTCKIDVDGLLCVLDLRSRYGEAKTTFDDPLKYCDLTYFEQAVGCS
jgi:ABC-type nitrate/sulfonate/bicarbonate transport system substrate-binding protein